MIALMYFMYSFLNFEPVHCSMSGSNCCFLTCIQISQVAGKVVWYSHLFKNFLQFVVTDTFKGFSIVNEAEIDGFFSGILLYYADFGSLISGSSAITKSSLYSWKFLVYTLLKRILSITLLACVISAIVQ